MRTSQFETIVEAVILTIPEEFRRRMANLAVVVEGRPSAEFCRREGLDPVEDCDLLGLYHGVPLTERWGDMSGSLPDKITLFQEVIEEEAGSDQRVPQVVGQTIVHELAHFLGFDEEQARRLEARWETSFSRNYRGPGLA